MWFEKLSYEDKSVVLTVVDKQLVNLVYHLYKIYSQEGNVKFLNHQIPASQSDDYVKVK